MALDGAPCLRERAGVLESLRRNVIGPRHDRLSAVEPWLRAAIPAFVLVFLATLAISEWRITAASRLEAIDNAARSLEEAAEALALKIDGLAGAGQAAVDALLAGAAIYRGRRLHVGDNEGKFVAHAPRMVAPPASVGHLLGGDHPLVLLAERAGALQIDLAGTGEALVAIHRLAAGGHVVVVEPLSETLAGWRAATSGHVTLVATSGFTLFLFALFFHWQGGRIRKGDQVSERLYDRIDTALSAGRCGLWDWDIARGHMHWSRSMFALLDQPERDGHVSFGEVAELIHPDDVDLLQIAADALAGTTSSIDHEFRIRCGDSWRWVRARASMLRDPDTGAPHFVGIVVDVTDQRRTKEEAATSDLRLRDAIDVLSSAFVLWDRDDRLVIANTRFRELHGLPPGTLQRGTGREAILEKGTRRDPLREVVLEEADGGSSRALEILLEDGRWMQVNERRTKDGGHVSVFTDITAIKRQQVELEDQKIELKASENRLLATVADLRRSRQTLEAQAQKLAELAELYGEQKLAAESASRAKSEFLANMSHELRTPLNAILGFSEVMQAEVFGALGSPKYSEYCADICRSGNALLAVIDDVLDMSRIEAGRVKIAPCDIDVDSAVKEAAERVCDRARTKDQVLSLEPAAGIRVVSDPGSLRQILAALLENAVKFTPEGGRVTFRARVVGEGVNLYVEDTGIGIPRAALSKVANPFELVEQHITKRHGGSGLGLAIAKSLAALNRGSMRIRSIEGSGTIVMVRLPKAA